MTIWTSVVLICFFLFVCVKIKKHFFYTKYKLNKESLGDVPLMYRRVTAPPTTTGKLSAKFVP